MSVTSSRCYPRAVKTFPDRRPFCPTLSGRIRSAPTEPIFSCQTDPIRAAVTACANHQTQGGSMNDQVYFLFTMSDYLPSKAQAGKLFDARRELALSSRRPASRAGYRTSQPAPNEPGNENAWDLESNSGAESTGGARRDRTDDLMLAKHALSQLSYGPIVENKVERLAPRHRVSARPNGRPR
jgi:hypothetical protein